MRAVQREQPAVIDARRNPRFLANGLIAVEILYADLTLELRDLGAGGFSIIAPRAFPRGMTHRFTFATPAGQSVRLLAKAIHCRQEPPTTGAPRFVTGWEFMAGSAEATNRSIEALLETVIAGPAPQ